MGTFRVQIPNTLGRTALVVSLGLLTGVAWLALWLTESSAQSLLHLHHHSLAAIQPTVMFSFLFVAGWTVMTVAMMLPTTLPLVTTFYALVQERRDRAWLVTLVVTGYIGAWTVFGGLVYLGSLGAQWLLRASTWLQQNHWAAGAGLLLVAGLFQFSPLKYRCLDKCRSPLSFVMGHWHGKRPRGEALRLGIDHGLFCVGCCWALMLLMFVVGVDDLRWMLLLGLIMAVEKNMPWGRRMSAPLGVLLIGWAVFLLALA